MNGDRNAFWLRSPLPSCCQLIHDHHRARSRWMSHQVPPFLTFFSTASRVAFWGRLRFCTPSFWCTKPLGVSGKARSRSLLWDFIHAVPFWKASPPACNTHFPPHLLIIPPPPLSPAQLTGLSGALTAEVGVAYWAARGLWVTLP